MQSIQGILTILVSNKLYATVSTPHFLLWNMTTISNAMGLSMRWLTTVFWWLTIRNRQGDRHATLCVSVPSMPSSFLAYRW